METIKRRGDIFDPCCPTRLILDRIGDKWSVLVLLTLERGPHRFSELRRAISGVTPKVLTQTLRAMERDGFLTREVFAEVPPRVEYALTPLGASLTESVAALTRWAEDHIEEILKAREAYDLRPGPRPTRPLRPAASARRPHRPC